MSSSVIGVDLGGTKIAIASLCGRELSESTIAATELSSGDVLLDQLTRLIEEFAADDVEAVGIGVPSIVEFDTGRVVSSVNVPLADVPLRQVLGERLGLRVFVDNDATVAALAEAHDDQLQMAAYSLVMITVGTGVGGGVVLGGRIYRGATGGAGELGHTLVAVGLNGHVPAPTRFPQPGSLEAIAAGKALDHIASESAQRHPESRLARLSEQGKPVRGADAVAAAHEGDEYAIDAVKRWGEHLGIGIANAINTFDPDEVVIGGGAARAGELLLEPARRIALGYVVPGLGTRTTIRLARHGVRAGVLGAALLAAHELELEVADRPHHAVSADTRDGLA